MLVLTLKENEKIQIKGDAIVSARQHGAARIKFCIDAPKTTRIDRLDEHGKPKLRGPGAKEPA
jgi:sRNA-binding carbon storage regulator CsrA